MTTIKLQNKDHYTLCPVPGSVQGATFPLQVGTKLRHPNGQVLTVKGSTNYMAWFTEKVNITPTASKATPQEIELEIVDEAQPQGEE